MAEIVKKINKIKYEHLDKTLIDWLSRFMQKGTIHFEDLSVDLQDIVRGAGNGTNYNDVPIRKEIEKKADKTELPKYFNKNVDKVSTTLLDSELKNIINSVKELNQALGSGVRLEDDLIQLEDLDPSIKNKIEGMDEQLARLRVLAESLQRVADQINANSGELDLGGITNSISELKEQVKTAQTNISDINSLMAALDTRVGSNATKMTTLQNQMKTKANLVDGYLVEQQIPPSIPRHYDIEALNSRIDNFILGGSAENQILPVYFVLTEEAATAARTAKKAIIADLSKNRMLLLAEKIRNPETWELIPEMSAASSVLAQEGIGEYLSGEDTRYIYEIIENMSGNSYLVNKILYDVDNNEYVFNEAGNFISLRSGLAKYIVPDLPEEPEETAEEPKEPKEDGLEDTEERDNSPREDVDLGTSAYEYFLNKKRTVATPGDISESMSIVKKVSIGFGDKTELKIEKPHVRNIKTLVKDTVKNSRSINKWINGEGMITVVYDIDNNKAVFYNDAQTAIEAMIIYNKE